MFKNRYQYTCPDVIHYRKNQYRLVVWSNVASFAYMAVIFGVLSSLGKKTEPIEITEPVIPNE